MSQPNYKAEISHHPTNDEEAFNQKEQPNFEGPDNDHAQRILAAHANEHPPTPDEIRKVRRRIDMFMLPLLVFVYGLQYLDKVTYGIGSNFGVLQDLGLQTYTADGTRDLSRFKIGSMIFWTGYIAGNFPLSFLAQRLKPSTSSSLYAVLWGGIFLCAPACHSYQGIYIQRFFLGFMEAGITPCFMILTAVFYTKPEQAFRSAIWFGGTGWAKLIGYPVMYGVLSIDMSIPKWQALYYLWGALTVFSGIAFYFIVPDTQEKAYFLTERQKFVAVERLRKNQAGGVNVHFQWYQVREALTDPRCLIMIPLAFLSVIPNACVSTFSPLVLRGLGYTPMRTLIMTMPQGAVNIAAVYGYGYLQQKFKNIRSLCYTASIVPIIVCSALLWKLPDENHAGRLAAVTLFTTFTSAFVTILSLTVSNNSGHTKRSWANAMFLMGYSVGQVAAPLTYPATESPRFPTGFMVTMICLVLGIFLMWIYGWLCWRENRRRDAMGEIAQTDRAFHDMTDKENLSFRYTY